MSEHSDKSKLAKIVCFDEESATDFIQIAMGGNLERTAELLDTAQTTKQGEVSAEGSFNIGSLLRSLLSLKGGVSADGNLSGGKSTEKIFNIIITNTILSDFLSLAHGDLKSGDKEQSEKILSKAIEIFDDYNLKAPPNSLTHMITVTPFLNIVGNNTLNTGEMEIALNRIDQTIKQAKGYFEFIGSNKNNKNEVVFRFNLNSLRNNYKITDLLRMDISIYAIKVGRTHLKELEFEHEMDLDSSKEALEYEPYADRNKDDIRTEESEKLLDVYDVILAGVKYDR